MVDLLTCSTFATADNTTAKSSNMWS